MKPPLHKNYNPQIEANRSLLKAAYKGIAASKQQTECVGATIAKFNALVAATPASAPAAEAPKPARNMVQEHLDCLTRKSA